VNSIAGNVSSMLRNAMECHVMPRKVVSIPVYNELASRTAIRFIRWSSRCGWSSESCTKVHRGVLDNLMSQSGSCYGDRQKPSVQAAQSRRRMEQRRLFWEGTSMLHSLVLYVANSRRHGRLRSRIIDTGRVVSPASVSVPRHLF
jgi:hypothetical protein